MPLYMIPRCNFSTRPIRKARKRGKFDGKIFAKKNAPGRNLPGAENDLLGAEDAVAGIAQTGNDVTVIVQALVQTDDRTLRTVWT